ncbi:hypothetical protein D7Y22_08820 [Stenotrophomonas maltophilia]|nr:hypothetical protein [Stenotrophomonas maltophilia]
MIGIANDVLTELPAAIFIPDTKFCEIEINLLWRRSDPLHRSLHTQMRDLQSERPRYFKHIFGNPFQQCQQDLVRCLKSFQIACSDIE